MKAFFLEQMPYGQSQGLFEISLPPVEGRNAITQFATTDSLINSNHPDSADDLVIPLQADHPVMAR